MYGEQLSQSDYRRLAEIDKKFASLQAEKRALLQAILAAKQGLAMPDKKIRVASDKDLEAGNYPKEKAPARKRQDVKPEKKSAAPADTEPEANSD